MWTRTAATGSACSSWTKRTCPTGWWWSARTTPGTGGRWWGEELRYNQDAQELSLRFTDRDDSSQSAVLSGVRLNSELFTLKQGIFTEGDPAQIHLGYSYDQYLVTISACLLYAIGQSDMNWSWKGFVRGLSAVFTCVAVVSFVVATVLAPAVVVAGGAVMVAVTGANSVWAGVAVGSAALAVASAVGAEYIDEPETYTKTKAEYGSGTQEEPPMVAVWQVDSSGEPQDNPGQDGWFTNDGIVHLHYQDQDATEQYLCLQWLGGGNPPRVLGIRAVRSIRIASYGGAPEGLLHKGEDF